MLAYNKEFINPEAYPKFIKNDLLKGKYIATKLTQIDLEKFYKHCYFLLKLYFSILALDLTSMIICSIYLLPPF